MSSASSSSEAAAAGAGATARSFRKESAHDGSSAPHSETPSEKDGDSPKPSKESYTYEAPWTLYSLACSARPGPQYQYRFAVGSFIEEYSNKVKVIQLDPEKGEFVECLSLDHPYPTTKIMFAPEELASHRDIMITTGDYLRIWNIMDNKEARQEAIMTNNRYAEYCSPLTSFDWNTADANIVGVCSIDTTCTIWDVSTKQARTQLIAHDDEVFDISFKPGSPHNFATSGADGSIRVFDLRDLEHSTIMYETNDHDPLLRIRWNPMNQNYLATFRLHNENVVILDWRMPATPVVELSAHSACINGIAWAPHSAGHIVSAGDDNQALIWELAKQPAHTKEPVLAYKAPAEINNVQWDPSLTDWVTICFENKFQLLRV